jgi:mono/diheme cytochrome c family protein
MRFLLATAIVCAAGAATAADDVLARGAYLASIGDCGGCHTPSNPETGPDMSRPFAGGSFGFSMPGLGVFYPPNLTPDAETGLGKWSAEEIAAAIRTGVRPDGRELAPIMPWRSYAAMSDEDVTALVAYLRSVAPIVNQVPGPFGPSEAPSAPYLAMVVPE